MIDIHSHIMPDLDDGARSLEEAVEMAEIAIADGILQMVSTSHMFNALSHDPEPSEILERVAKLQESIGNKLKILPGNEVHLSPGIVDHAKNNRVTTINQKNYMLVEFPQLTIPVGAAEVLHKLQLQRIRPIIVHPERNVQIQNNPAVVAEFIDQGILIQVTAMSVTGEFGRAAKKCVDTLLRHNCVHFIATDAHRAKRRRPILSRGREAAAAIVGEEKAHRLVGENPLAVINGQPVPVESPIPFFPEKRSGLLRFLR
jgi:protein-tyrosine phosphatase